MISLPAHLPDDPDALETVIASHEQAAGPLKGQARAKIVWHNTQKKKKTPFSIVYLHGFKGSQGEGNPVHKTIAQKFGCNLYLARLHGHGLKQTHNFERFSLDALLQSAVDACRVGEKIGEKVIVMGTSTGASLGLYAAGSPACPVSVKALILYSPLIHLYGINALLLENTIGRTLLRLFPGKNYTLKYDPFTPDEETIWYSSYRLNGALVLGKMVQKIMRPHILANVSCPVFAGYYYKDKHNHDRVVSTAAIKKMMPKLGTPPKKQKLVNFSQAGTHVIANSLLSNAVQDVIAETSLFLKHNIGLSETA